MITLPAFSQVSVVAVGEAEVERTKISFSTSVSCNCLEYANVIRSDLGMYKHKLQIFDSDLVELENFDYQFILSRDVKLEKQLVLTIKKNNEPVNTQSFKVANDLTSIRDGAHEISDLIYSKVFNKTSIFKTKIYFISDNGRNEQGQKSKQLFVVDYDGQNPKQLTFHNGYVFSPAISRGQKFALYSVIMNNSMRKNVNLHILDLESGIDRVLSNFKGINSGAVFVPGEKEIILTLTHSGNAELYRMNIKSKKLVPLTRHFASDVDPSISPSGKKVAFLSSRAGRPMIYTLNASKTEFQVKRVSYVGDYNATPRYSPDGKDIIFSSWLDKKFDLFRLSETGMNLVRLTKDHGSNESPSYSPDGEFVVFSSQRIIDEKSDVKNLYIMTKDGDILKKVSSKLGKAESPVWAK